MISKPQPSVVAPVENQEQGIAMETREAAPQPQEVQTSFEDNEEQIDDEMEENQNPNSQDMQTHSGDDLDGIEEDEEDESDEGYF